MRTNAAHSDWSLFNQNGDNTIAAVTKPLVTGVNEKRKDIEYPQKVQLLVDLIKSYVPGVQVVYTPYKRLDYSLDKICTALVLPCTTTLSIEYLRFRRISWTIHKATFIGTATLRWALSCWQRSPGIDNIVRCLSSSVIDKQPLLPHDHKAFGDAESLRTKMHVRPLKSSSSHHCDLNQRLVICRLKKARKTGDRVEMFENCSHTFLV